MLVGGISLCLHEKWSLIFGLKDKCMILSWVHMHGYGTIQLALVTEHVCGWFNVLQRTCRDFNIERYYGTL